MRTPWLVLMTCMTLALLSSSAFCADASALRFIPGEKSEFVFDTGVLRGKLRADGKSAGLSSVVHVPTGMRLDASMGLFSHYRVFSRNHRFGTAAWDWPSEARLTEKGDVEVRWPATAERTFELGAIYHWAGPETIDLQTRVVAKTNLPNFEVFLASYFAASFTNAEVQVAQTNGDSGKPRFMAAERDLGNWQAFPRDKTACAIIRDGRWKYEPNPVDWVLMPQFAEPLGFRRCPANGLTGVLMASRKDCFAILLPFQTEPHYSMYLSLFGYDVQAGQTARVRTRLLMAEHISDAEMIKAQRVFR